MFMSPFQLGKTHRGRRKQVRKALYMLSVSGVVRPGHIETRYFAQTARIDAVYRRSDQPASIPPDKPMVLSSWRRPVKAKLARIRHLMGSFRPARLQSD